MRGHIALVAAALVVGAAPASAAPSVYRYGPFSVESGKSCLRATLGTPVLHTGTTGGTVPCGNTFSYWFFIETTDGRAVLIQNHHTGSCLSPHVESDSDSGDLDGDDVEAVRCDDDDADQRWYIGTRDGGATTTLRTEDDRYITISSTGDTVALDEQTTAAKPQSWTLRSVTSSRPPPDLP
ncbi:hypothetical protein JOD54_006734 [Actinokineospora baliensis]|uniref:RICIN domain-containing protein n=1 Tax=Actinokineospora baliensis TaxID=547056 RepID=UPI00195C76CD|nr:RICIN domain-containing protein [Actinokineospora baliensis]MBM7776530.1 hypothetical protein [Actinokineospora baliensis]